MIRRFQYLILQLWGYAVFRKRVYVHGPFAVGNRLNVSVGEGCSINRGVYILGHNSVQIGNRVTLSARCMLMDSGLAMEGERRHVKAQIVIEDDVWVGAGAIILPDVVLGRGCVIGAGSIVTKSVPPGCVYVGNPARMLRDAEGRRND